MRRFHFDTTDSTNTQARRLAGEHPDEPLVVSATEQTAGRGRQGRTWHSPPGGAWLSLAWPLRQPPAAYAAAALAAAVAVRQALCAVAPDAAAGLRIKWPNDLLLSDHKVAGILCEQSVDGTGARGALIVGVGVNVDFDLALLGNGLRRPATTLAHALGRSVSAGAVVDAVAAELAAGLARFETTGLDGYVLGALRAHLAFVGTVRTWESAQGPVAGKVLGVDDAGRLLLEGPAGRVAVATGELVE